MTRVPHEDGWPFGGPSADGGLPEPAPEVIMAANGIYWRRYRDSLSMPPASDDNDPVLTPVAVYGLVGWEDHDGTFRCSDALLECVSEALIPHLTLRCGECAGTGFSILSNLDCRSCGGTGYTRQLAREIRLAAARDAVQAMHLAAESAASKEQR